MPRCPGSRSLAESPSTEPRNVARDRRQDAGTVRRRAVGRDRSPVLEPSQRLEGHLDDAALIMTVRGRHEADPARAPLGPGVPSGSHAQTLASGCFLPVSGP